MTEQLKEYESSLKRKHSFGWTPKYEDEFHTELNKRVFIPIAKKVIEKLGWDLIYQEESVIEAKQKAEGFHWGQKVTVSFELGKVKVNSKSLGNEMWDLGRNSKRVRLFIYAFQELEKEYDKDSLTELEEKVEKENNWDDYVIPESLPLPKQQSKPKVWIPIIGGLILSIILGYLIAFLTVEISYVIGIYEVAVGFLIGLGFKYFIRTSNYMNFDRLAYLLVGVVLTTYVLNQYFLYGLIISKNNIEPIGFIEFIRLRLQEGLTIKSMNTGWIGLVISWIFQCGFTYAISYLQVINHFTQFQLEKVPMEVVDFAFYHFVKDKSEEEVRSELSKMGWVKKENQDDVFNSIGAIREMQELNRI